MGQAAPGADTSLPAQATAPRRAQKRAWFYAAIVGGAVAFIVVVLLIIGLILQARTFGTKLTFNGAELYYTSNVTEADAKKLGQYFVRAGIFDEKQRVAQLSKSGSSWEFRMVVREEQVRNEELLVLCGQLTGMLSKDVFDGAPVDLLLCNADLKTLRVVPSRSVDWKNRKKLTFEGSGLYYFPPVTEAEAQRLGKYLVEIGMFGPTPLSVGITKGGGLWVFRYVVKEGSEKSEQFAKEATDLADSLSKGVFGGAPVQFHACDDELKTLRILESRL